MQNQPEIMNCTKLYIEFCWKSIQLCCIYANQFNKLLVYSRKNNNFKIYLKTI